VTHPIWLRDSIGRRFAIAIAAAAAACVLLNVLADALIGGPAFGPPLRTDLLDRLPGIVRMVDMSAPPQRAALASAASTRGFRVDWSPAAAPLPAAPLTLALVAGETTPQANALVARLQDGSSLVFSLRVPVWSWRDPAQWVLRIAILVVSLLVVSLVGASRLAGPIAAFAAAARRFGSDPNASPIPETGPAEIQVAVAAFNTMQSQIQRLVAGQAAMFAAISHDLRTPLTRLRLRGEFIEDTEQQTRLFRDVDEMEAMVAAVLTFLRDNASGEETTYLDLAELLRSIVDDYADLGTDVAYTGPLHLGFPGRPIGLRRAFGNLVDNAVKYGVQPAINLQLRPDAVIVTITDRGPGIPLASLAAVFMPFRRLEPSRNRNTGGMGLGLTSARAGFRAHGGDVTLSHVVGCGLRATVVLPLSPDRPELASRRGESHPQALPNPTFVLPDAK